MNSSLDGWSNVHNEPVICVTATDADGNSYLTDTIDTAGHAHNSQYLKDVTETAIAKIEERYECTVGSLVTDNAANMVKMREELGELRPDVVKIGCTAHQLNLLAKDMEITTVQQHVIQVVKYFRNCHLPNAWYKAAGGKKLPMVCEVRWNSVVDTLEGYISNWPKLLAVCEEHRDVIEPNITKKVNDLAIKRNVEDVISFMKPIAVAVDKAQASNCSLADSVHIWLSLKDKLKEAGLEQSKMKKVDERINKNLTLHHYMAYILTPKYCKAYQLSDDILEKVNRFISDRYPSLLPVLMNYQAQTGPFPQYRFEDGLLGSVSTVTWWKSAHGIESKDKETILRVLTSICSSANVERVFSSFGLVHSKLRNRLGTVKAGKLVFLFKLLN